jgi:hypothetical protein
LRSAAVFPSGDPDHQHTDSHQNSTTALPRKAYDAKRDGYPQHAEYRKPAVHRFAFLACASFFRFASSHERPTGGLPVIK